MTSPYSPLITDYPTSPDELEDFANGIPDEGQRRLGIAIARTLRQASGARDQADAAMVQARNARQMVLNRDPRFDTLDERIAGLATVTDQLKTTQARLDEIASSYTQALPISQADRADLRAKLNALTTRVDQLRTDVTANASAITAEVARATAAEQANDKAITDEVSRAKTAEAAEISLRQQGDTANAKAITDEASARQAADTTEAKTRADADTALASRVTALEALRLRGTTGSDSVSSLVAAGIVNRTVTLKTPMLSSRYLALPVIDTTSGINLSTVSVTVTGQTASTVTVQVRNGGLGLGQVLNYTVLAIELS